LLCCLSYEDENYKKTGPQEPASSAEIASRAAESPA
jgi:cell fate regulator YaaT (PSP1 superfamily)